MTSPGTGPMANAGPVAEPAAPPERRATVQRLRNRRIHHSGGMPACEVCFRAESGERSYGSFRRSIPLDVEVVTDQIEATFDKGVLTIDLPKTAEAKKALKKIPIRAAGARAAHPSPQIWLPGVHHDPSGRGARAPHCQGNGERQPAGPMCW